MHDLAGWSDAGLPDALARRMHDQAGCSDAVLTDASDWLSNAPCPQVDSYAPLTYVLRSASGDTFNLEVTQETYMVADDSENCQPAFMKLDLKKQYGPAMILGEVFMRHFFTVFSRGSGGLTEAKVGFAKAKLGATPKVSSSAGSVVQIQEASLMRRSPER
eukprot:s764_g2.t1